MEVGLAKIFIYRSRGIHVSLDRLRNSHTRTSTMHVVGKPTDSESKCRNLAVWFLLQNNGNITTNY